MSGFLCECRKIKGKLLSILLPVFGFIAVWTLWNYSKMSEVQTESGFYQLLFFYLVINSIFLPILAAVMASRLVDMATRGNTYKLLCTMRKKSSIFLNKLLLGVLLFFLLEALLAVFLKNYGQIHQVFPLEAFTSIYAPGPIIPSDVP